MDLTNCLTKIELYMYYIYYIHVDVIPDKNRKSYDREGQKIPAKFPQLLTFSGFSKPFLLFPKNILTSFFTSIKNPFGKSKKLKNCRKVAEKLQKSCGNFLPLSIGRYYKIIYFYTTYI